LKKKCPSFDHINISKIKKTSREPNENKRILINQNKIESDFRPNQTIKTDDMESNIQPKNNINFTDLSQKIIFKNKGKIYSHNNRYKNAIFENDKKEELEEKMKMSYKKSFTVSIDLLKNFFSEKNNLDNIFQKEDFYYVRINKDQIEKLKNINDGFEREEKENSICKKKN
jgi:hypothetical protein